VVVVCPKCRTKLKVDDTRLSPQGSRFKCPRCSTVLVIKKPAAQEKKALDGKKALIAHSNPSVVENIRTLLAGQGYTTLTAADGIDAMVKALKELPWLGIIEVALPKIYGFEVCKRLKSRPETKEMKFILVPSIYDKTKYRREPVSLYDADNYIEEHDLSTRLIDTVNRLQSGAPAEAETHQQKSPVPSAPDISADEKKPQPDFGQFQAPAAKISAEVKGDEMTEKARRLARTIVNDIYLYNSAKVDEAVRQDKFYAVFAAEVKEGKKLYDNRIPRETRDKADFYKEAIDNFLAAKKKALS